MTSWWAAWAKKNLTKEGMFKLGSKGWVKVCQLLVAEKGISYEQSYTVMVGSWVTFSILVSPFYVNVKANMGWGRSGRLSHMDKQWSWEVCLLYCRSESSCQVSPDLLILRTRISSQINKSGEPWSLGDWVFNNYFSYSDDKPYWKALS